MPLYFGTATTTTKGFVTLDGTAGDITEDGTQSAGTVGSPPDAGHTHPFAGGMWLPADNGYLGANADYANASGGVIAIAGTIYLQKIIVRKATTITNLIYACTVVGNDTSPTNNNFAGLYNSSGTRLTGSSNIASGFLSTGAVTCALTTPQALTAGQVVYAALLLNLGTTQPTLLRMQNSTVILNMGLSAAADRWATNGTSQSSLPSSLTLSSNATTALSFWVAWS